MKNYKRIAAITMAISLSACMLTACNGGAGAGQPAESDTASASEEVFTNEIAITAAPDISVSDLITETETTVAETAPEENPDYIPDKFTLLDNAFNAANGATSVEIDCNIKGVMPLADSSSAMINHSFKYMISGNTSYLESTYQDLNTDAAPVDYSEYQTIEDNIVTTLTKYKNDWVDNTPKEMVRTGMMTKALGTSPLIALISTDSAIADETLSNAVVTRAEDGNFILTVPAIDKLTAPSADFRDHLFTGLIRTPAIADGLYNIDNTMTDSSIVYTFDNSYYLKNMSFDIIVRQTDGYDLHCEINFDKWNNVSSIHVPNTVKIEEETETSETKAETTVTT